MRNISLIAILVFLISCSSEQASRSQISGVVANASMVKALELFSKRDKDINSLAAAKKEIQAMLDSSKPLILDDKSNYILLSEYLVRLGYFEATHYHSQDAQKENR